MAENEIKFTSVTDSFTIKLNDANIDLKAKFDELTISENILCIKMRHEGEPLYKCHYEKHNTSKYTHISFMNMFKATIKYKGKTIFCSLYKNGLMSITYSAKKRFNQNSLVTFILEQLKINNPHKKQKQIDYTEHYAASHKLNIEKLTEILTTKGIEIKSNKMHGKYIRFLNVTVIGKTIYIRKTNPYDEKQINEIFTDLLGYTPNFTIPKSTKTNNIIDYDNIVFDIDI